MNKSDKTAALIFILLMIIAIFGCFYAFTRVVAKSQSKSVQVDTTQVHILYEDTWGKAIKEDIL